MMALRNGRRWIMMWLGLLLAQGAGAEIYRWIDGAGRIHFGDAPPAQADAARIEVEDNVVASPAPGATLARRAPVVLYTTAWCGVCKKAKAYLRSKGIPFSEYDVEKNRTGRNEFRRLGGRGVPLILVGEQKMSGFQAERLAAMLREGGYTLAAP